MKRSEFLRGGVIAAGWLGTLSTFPALSATGDSAWPSQPIRVIVPTAPGGPSDLVARSWSQAIGTDWKATFIIDNKPGASQVIGTQAVATAAPDGYTLLQAASSMATMPLVVEKLSFDVNKNFSPISQTHLTPLVVVVNAKLPIKTIAELISYAKDQPGKLSFGHTGDGSSQQLATRLLAQKAGLRQLLEVPYKGSTQAHPDLIAGRIGAMIDPVSAVAPHIKSGALRALAVTTSDRVAAFPDLPTVAEAGLPGYEISSWGGVFAPAHTPIELVNRIQQALHKTLDTPETQRKFADLGLVVRTSSPAAFDAFVKAEVARWRAVMLAPTT